MESIKQVEERIRDVELLLGEWQSVNDLTGRLRMLSQELKLLYRDGIQCSESFWTLLERYMRANDFNEHSEWMQRFNACSEGIEKLLDRLYELDLVYQTENVDHVLSCGLLTYAESGSVDLRDLPTLYQQCNDLMLRTICAVRRFTALNLEMNEFSADVEARMRRAENALTIIYKKRTI